MSQVGYHMNLVVIVGMVTSGLPKLLVVSYCDKGSILGTRNCYVSAPA